MDLPAYQPYLQWKNKRTRRNAFSHMAVERWDPTPELASNATGKGPSVIPMVVRRIRRCGIIHRPIVSKLPDQNKGYGRGVGHDHHEANPLLQLPIVSHKKHEIGREATREDNKTLRELRRRHRNF